MSDQMSFVYPEVSRKEARERRLRIMLDKIYARHMVEAYRWRQALTAGDGVILDIFYRQLIAGAEQQAELAAQAIQNQIKDFYGLCQTCGAEISEDDLSALPFRKDCKHCESRKRFEEIANRRKAPLVLTG